ncbi:unnamed protein product [Bemisia tabaci]|uniref:Protein FAM98A n=1 Tax=Bemisia tabaci TaxID=7038 RepID=A0A9P0F5W1_BEMTA|nr:PREDICTED: protein FAM98A-like [Bemisia tabaci]CAH0393310.1 unnamed protein product [Bemisia tabaci]
MNNIIDALTQIGFTNVDTNYVNDILSDGPKSVKYTQLVEWLSKELGSLCALDDHVNAIASPDDSSAFMLELSGFLKEIGCNYKSLTEGHINDRLNSRDSRLLLLDYLISEVEAARMMRAHCPEESKTMSIHLQESSVAADLKNMLITLKFAKPPDNITPEVLFGKVQAKLKEVLSKVPDDLLRKPLFTGVLTDKQWFRLAKIQTELHTDYTIRREMLLKRLDVTVLSFEWSDKLKSKAQVITQSYTPKRQALTLEPNISIADVLAARDDLTIIEKTSSASVRRNTQSSINKVVIGQVPDRGGRPHEQQPPPPEMPSWQQRSSAPGPSSVGGTASTGGGSNRVQAGWNSGGGQRQTGDNYQNSRPAGNQMNQESRSTYHTDKPAYQDKGPGNFQDNRIGYQDNRGGYQDQRGGYQNNRGGYQDHRGGYQDGRSYQDSRGYQDNRNYRDNRGYQETRAYQDNRGYQDNRSNYQDNRGGYHDSRGGQSNRGAPQPFQNSTSNRGTYQNSRGAYQDNRGAQNNYQNFAPNHQTGYQYSNYGDAAVYQERNNFQDPRQYYQETKGYSENREGDAGRGGFNSRGGPHSRGRGRGRGRGAY